MLHQLPQTQPEVVVDQGVVVGMIAIDPMAQSVASRQMWVPPHPSYGTRVAQNDDDLDAMDVYFAGR